MLIYDIACMVNMSMKFYNISLKGYGFKIENMANVSSFNGNVF